MKFYYFSYIFIVQKIILILQPIDPKQKIIIKNNWKKLKK